MNVEREISEYENELASLKKALNLTDIKDIERRTEIAEQISEMEELLEDLKEEKNNSTKYRE